MDSAARLLAPDEPSPILLHPPGIDRAAWATGDNPFLLAADHAGRRIPRKLADLGLPESERARHIGWDIGIWAVTTHLAEALQTLAIGQTYSRLVIDCNRAPHWPSAIPEISESTEIPGNIALPPESRAARIAEIHTPYHAALAALVATRRTTPHPLLYVAMHSFTPTYKGIPRPWHAGVLYDQTDTRSLPLAEIMLSLLRAEPGLVVGDNQPYILSATADHAVPTHAQANAIPYLELEIRQDLIAAPEGQRQWAALLARLIPAAWSTFTATGAPPMTGIVFEHIHLRSPNPEATAQFYEHMFGAEIIRSTVAGAPRIDIRLGGMDIFIAPVTPGSNVAPPPQTPYQGLDHFGLRVPDLDAITADLKSKGADFTMEPTNLRPGLRIAFIRGPEGVSIELLQRDPI